MAERIGARNGTGGAVLREIMRLDTHFWARRVWVDFRKPSWYICTSSLYYNSPTLRHSPTPQPRGLNLKGPGGRPRGRGKWRPQENKTQPTATASTGGKKGICDKNAQKCQKCSVGKCPSGARRNRSTGGLNRNYIALNVWWRAAASNLEERPKTAENGRVWRVFDAAGRRPAERKFITFYYW